MTRQRVFAGFAFLLFAGCDDATQPVQTVFGSIEVKALTAGADVDADERGIIVEGAHSPAFRPKPPAMAHR